MELSKIEGGVCVPLGFRSSAVSCGIKLKAAPRLDLALIYSDHPTVGAAVFTENQVKAAPVQLSAKHIRLREPRAIVANSGNANACTGAIGLEHATMMANATAAALGLDPAEVQVCSTGIIGLTMPIEKIESRILELVEGLQKADEDAARAIMTSDTKPKSCAVEYIDLDGKTIRIGAIAKGAGMINPRMATMLCFVTTDVAIKKSELVEATRFAVEHSFNCISVDGDMSTNDTVIVMANGQAGNQVIQSGGKGSEDFRNALREVLLTLAKKMVGDGERVTKLVTVKVRGAATPGDAEKVARAVSNSKLVKCSWNGNDPNWGRIIHAIGYAGAKMKEDQIDIFLNDLAACENGLVSEVPLLDLISVVSEREFTVNIDLKMGNSEYTMYTADLSPEYVVFNRAEYSLKEKKS